MAGITRDDVKEIVRSAVEELAAVANSGFDKMGKRMDKVENRLTKVETSVSKLTDTVGGLAISVKDLEQEVKMGQSRGDRHERWIGKVADKVGVELES